MPDAKHVNRVSGIIVWYFCLVGWFVGFVAVVIVVVFYMHVSLISGS